MRKRIAILGSTGSIGINALKVASSLGDKFEVVALSAGSNIKELAAQSRRYGPKVLCVRDEPSARKLASSISPSITVLNGISGLEEIVSRNDVDMVLFAISGSSCLIPLIRAINNKKAVALANKEALVSAGAIVMELAKKKRVSIIPIDSEHSAIFQCLEGKRDYLKKIYLTATGGSLLDVAKNRFNHISRAAVLNHPKWKMGNKITVDSATMMNKGLEIIEARWLFDIEARDIEVLVHPEAIIHSMIELVDGMVFAQMSMPDMRIPIQYAMTYPERFRTKTAPVDFLKLKDLTFRPPDTNKFPCLRLAREALVDGGTYPAVLNAADEEAVNEYLKGSINFTHIPVVIEKVLSRHKAGRGKLSICDVIGAERWAREEIHKLCH